MHSENGVTDSAYLARQKAYLESEIEAGHPPRSDIAGVFNQIARLALGRGPLNEETVHASLRLIHARRDLDM